MLYVASSHQNSYSSLIWQKMQVMLPTGKFLIINGAKSGYAGKPWPKLR
jgi:hypothetical protein